ncbi:hypothetical protein RIR_e18449_A0A2N1MX71_9GLOM [Rhizophagus irregularis DAOM 181602=DAOM 197198]|uniref:Uncharacterized protein n=1 Tax=Rhizophagus irregularis TaxID=588596 RepID=A0A2N1MX71_9GLOM|nr:hypothetical protein RhiirC2_753749 [Rhizophagus irregularis]GET55493.1 hypothetical protein RIR_e18449_A0A2N1MX71_9GLOM [Rhizophagus irregularis DAOM 181602=DAOM 197198]
MEEHAEGALSENTLSSEEFDPNQLEEDNGDVRFQELTAFSGSSSSVWIYFDKDPVLRTRL